MPTSLILATSLCFSDSSLDSLADLVSARMPTPDVRQVLRTARRVERRGCTDSVRGRASDLVFDLEMLLCSRSRSCWE